MNTHSDSTEDIRKRVSQPETHKSKEVKTVKKISILQRLSPSKLLVFNGVERDQVGKGGVMKETMKETRKVLRVRNKRKWWE